MLLCSAVFTRATYKLQSTPGKFHSTRVAAGLDSESGFFQDFSRL